MSCPDLDTIGRHVDGELPPPDEQRVAAHVLDCDRCRADVVTLEGTTRALGEARTWHGPSRCITPGDLLIALSGGEPLLHVQQHVTQCASCQGELAGLSDALLSHEKGATERVSPALKTRLRRLGASKLAGSTVDEQGVGVALGKRSSTKLTLPPPAPEAAAAPSSRRTSRRMQSASARTSGTGQSARRRGSAKLAVPGRAPSPFGPAWAWGAMAAAAMVLVAIALALSPPRARDVARGPAAEPSPPSRPTPRTPGGGPLVSDSMGRKGEPARSSAPATDEPAYPLPDEVVDALPPPLPHERPLPPLPGEPEGELAPIPPELAGGTTTRPLPGAGRSPEDAPPAPPPTPGNGPLPDRIVDDGGRVELALSRLAGAVSLVRGEGAEALARGEGAVTLRPGDRLRTRTGAGAGAFLSLNEGAYELCLDQGSELVVRAAAGGPVLGLERGRVLAEVTSLPAGERFVVATAQGTFSVLGTVFAVEAASDAARLTVAEGLVQAHSAHGQAEVPAGAGVSIATGEGPGPVRPADPSRLAWARPWQPRREVLYLAKLDDARSLGGFQGDLVEDTTWLDSPGALRFGPATDNRYWGLVARAPKSRLRAFRAAPDVYVQFSVWSEKDTKVLFETVNETQNKEFKRGLANVPAGRWKTYTVPLMELTTYFDPGKSPVRENDLLVDLEVYAGDPGDAFKVVLDEVVVFRKHYD